MGRMARSSASIRWSADDGIDLDLQLYAVRTSVSFAGMLIWEGSAAVYGDPAGTNRASGARFYPYGDEITSTSNDRTKFATYNRDSFTGFDYADQRYYASTYGRFNTADPYKRERWARESRAVGTGIHTRGVTRSIVMIRVASTTATRTILCCVCDSDGQNCYDCDPDAPACGSARTRSIPMRRVPVCRLRRLLPLRRLLRRPRRPRSVRFRCTCGPRGDRPETTLTFM